MRSGLGWHVEEMQGRAHDERRADLGKSWWLLAGRYSAGLRCEVPYLLTLELVEPALESQGCRGEGVRPC